MSRRASFATVLVVALCVSVPALAYEPRCVGDCDADGIITDHDLGLLTEEIFSGGGSDICPGTGIPLRARAAQLVAAVRLAFGDTSRCPATPGPSPTATVTPVPSSHWVTLSPLRLGPRQEVGVALLGATVFVIGGFEGPVPAESNRVEVYDIESDSWHSVANLPVQGHHIGAATVGGMVYAVGGLSSGAFIPSPLVFRYDADSDRWQDVAPLPKARGALAAVEINGKLHAIGGSGDTGSLTDHTMYDPAQDAWTVLAPLPSARNHIAGAAIGDKIYIVGGRGGANTAELDRYDPVTDHWDVMTPMPTARSGHAAAVVQGRLIVMGGEGNASNPPSHTFPQVEVYDPDNDRWSSLEPMAVPRHGIGAVTFDGKIYVPGGAAREGFGATSRNDVLVIDRFAE